jgi:hypothetical protein
LTAEPTPGGAPFHFNTSRLNAKAGRIQIRLTNAGAAGHIVRIQSGQSCCFHGNKDLGGTQTVDPGQTTTGFVTLKPGRYFFLDPWGGFWRAYGVLTVT